MTKRKIILIFSVLMVALFLLSRANKSHKYESMLVWDLNTDIGIKSDCSYIWDGVYFDAECDEVVNYPFLDYKLNGNYYSSIFRRECSYRTDYYYSDENYRFGVRSDNNTVVSFDRMNHDYFEQEPYLDDIEDAETYALDYGKKIAEELIGSLDEYQMLPIEKWSITKTKDGRDYVLTWYVLVFERKVCGLESSDWISVRVNSKGHLDQFSMGDINVFEGQTLKINSKDIEASVNKKIKEKFDKIGMKIDSTDISRQILGKTPEGEYCITSLINADIIDSNGEKRTYLLTVYTFLNKY